MSNKKIKMKIERIINIKGLIQVYIGLNRENESVLIELWAILSHETYTS